MEENINVSNTEQVNDIISMSVENAVYLYALIKYGKEKIQELDLKQVEKEILNGNQPLMYQEDENNKGLLEQMVLWVMAGYGNFGKAYLDVLVKDEDYTKQVIAGFSDLLDSYAEAVEKAISANQILCDELRKHNIDIPEELKDTPEEAIKENKPTGIKES